MVFSVWRGKLSYCSLQCGGVKEKNSNEEGSREGVADSRHLVKTKGVSMRTEEK